MAKSYDWNWWKDFVSALPGETKKATIDLGDTIGETVGGVIEPTAKAVSKPLMFAAIIAVVACIGYLFFKMRGKA